MRTIPYADVERGVAAIAGISPDNILAHEKVILANYITDAVRYVYEYHPWPELLVTEKRYFRDEWQLGEYPLGAEVYHNGKYYRKNVDNWANVDEVAPSEDEYLRWYEIGEIYSDPEWSEKGLYERGARVTYKGDTYMAKFYNEPSYVGGKLNYEWDGVTPEDTARWDKLDTSFDRYIPYEATGKNTIGTILSIHADDPRYNDTTPLNWREGAEGIYVEGGPSSPVGYWVKYRIDPPLLNEDSDYQILNFLAPAIKALSYKSWLIGDGQHEKSMLVESQVYDLLIREVDKINSQQDRNQQYSISYEPYRRVNALGDQLVGATEDKIGSVIDGSGEITFKLTSSGQGRQSVVSRSVSPIWMFSSSRTNARSSVKFGNCNISFPIWTRLRFIQNFNKSASAHSSMSLFTGKAFQSIGIGFVNASAQRDIESNISLSVDPIQYNMDKSARVNINAFLIVAGVEVRKSGSVLADATSTIDLLTTIEAVSAYVLTDATSTIQLLTTIEAVLDRDGDGVPDHLDAFPDDATQTTDTDGDGYGDNPLGNNPDAFPNDATQTTDTDGDGYGDNPLGNNPDAFPNDPTESVDTDGDGVGDNADQFPNDPSQTTIPEGSTGYTETYSDISPATYGGTKELEMVYCEAGTFTMGQSDILWAREHEVTLTKGFYLGKYEVTQAQYEAVMTGNTDGLSATPSNWPNNPDRPVDKVSWEDVQKFLARLNEQQADSLPAGWEYALPTEAQWEYACRAGTITKWSWGDTTSASDANYRDSGYSETSNVGLYPANPWGFFDIHGNVWEWVADAWTNQDYPSEPQTDPFIEGSSGSYRSRRGGSWDTAEGALQSAFRNYNTPTARSSQIGFRVALVQTSADTDADGIVDAEDYFYDDPYETYTKEEMDTFGLDSSSNLAEWDLIKALQTKQLYDPTSRNITAGEYYLFGGWFGGTQYRAIGRNGTPFDSDGNIRLLDTTERGVVWEKSTRTPVVNPAINGAVNLDTSGNGEWVSQTWIDTDGQCKISVYDLTTGSFGGDRVRFTISPTGTTTESYVWGTSVAISDDGSTLVANSDNGNVYVWEWDGSSYNLTYEQTLNINSVTLKVAIRPNGLNIVVGDGSYDSGNGKLWRLINESGTWRQNATFYSGSQSRLGSSVAATSDYFIFAVPATSTGYANAYTWDTNSNTNLYTRGTLNNTFGQYMSITTAMQSPYNILIGDIDYNFYLYKGLGSQPSVINTIADGGLFYLFGDKLINVQNGTSSGTLSWGSIPLTSGTPFVPAGQIVQSSASISKYTYSQATSEIIYLNENGEVVSLSI